MEQDAHGRPVEPTWLGSAARLIAASLAIAAAVGGESGCRPQPVAGGLRIAHEAEPISLDPAGVAEAATHSILSNFYEPLCAFDRNMMLVPALAVRWTTPDERTWVFELRRGVHFHDGRPLTPADVKASIERARDDPASGIQSVVASVEAIEIAGDATVTLRTRYPDALLANRLAYAFIAPAAPPGHDWSTPIGTGPYRFVRWDRGRAIEAVAFAEHWGGKPGFERVEFRVLPEGAAGLAALREGSVDVLRYVPEMLADQVPQIPGYRLGRHLGLLSFYLWFDPRPAAGPFADRRVRQAASLAIDRFGLVRQLGGHGSAAEQFVQQGVFGHVTGLPELRHDPDAARRLLAEAGYPHGFEIALAHRSSASIAAVAEQIRQQLGNVGIRIRLVTPDWTQMIAEWKAQRLPFFLAGWYFENGDAMSFYRDCLRTQAPSGGRGSFNPGYSNPELDRLVDGSPTIISRSDQLDQFRKLTDLALEEMPLVPLYHRENLYAVANHIRWQPRLDGMLLAVEMSHTP